MRIIPCGTRFPPLKVRGAKGSYKNGQAKIPPITHPNPPLLYGRGERESLTGSSYPQKSRKNLQKRNAGPDLSGPAGRCSMGFATHSQR